MGLVFTLTVSMRGVGWEERLIERERETSTTRQSGSGEGRQETSGVQAVALRARESTDFIVHLSHT